MRKNRTPTRRRSETTAPAQEKARAPTYDDLLAIVRLIESGSRFSDFRLRSGDIEVEIHRPNGEIGPRPIAAEAAAGVTANVIPAAAPAAMGRDPISVPEGHHVIRAPMVGTFYRSPEPGAPPFIDVGAKVKADTTVCIIEVMKLMNSVAAGVKGTVTHVFAENAQMVEYGQPLIAIRPA